MAVDSRGGASEEGLATMDSREGGADGRGSVRKRTQGWGRWRWIHEELETVVDS
jgi:hypothetical protein